MPKRRVLVTGAAGRLAVRMIPDLAQQYELVLVDVRQETVDGEHWDAIQLVDLTQEDRDSYRHVFQGIDTVIHSAIVKPGSLFRSAMANTQMAYNIYQTALEEQVRRVVVIGSNHAADYYERLVHQGYRRAITPDLPPYAVNFYGWGKICSESLGFVYAAGYMAEGQSLENVQIRIGSPRDGELRYQTGDLQSLHRSLGAYLSVRDQVQLVNKCIETEDIRDENGVPFQVFYGVSGNSRAFWDTGNARRVVGYQPEDDSSVLFADQVWQALKGSS